MDFESRLENLFNTAQISDIHINAGDPVWIRYDGSLMVDSGDPVLEEDIVHFLNKRAYIHDDCRIKMEKNGDCDFATEIGIHRLRCNAFKFGGKHSLAMRKLQNQLPELEKLGVSPVLRDVLSRSKGLFLVTGATGSGKTTTLAAIIQWINKTREEHIITLEDPIEYVYPSELCRIAQRQVGKDVPSFVQGLKASLRQDPDIILIGEIRDAETVKVALDAANTGHLVMGTLHTMSARQSVERLNSFFQADEKDWANQIISSTLIGIQSQVLVPRANGQGRAMAYEMLVNTQGIRSLIKDGKIPHISTSMETGSEDGQQLLNKTLLQLIQNNEISVEDAMLATYDVEALRKELKYL